MHGHEDQLPSYQDAIIQTAGRNTTPRTRIEMTLEPPPLTLLQIFFRLIVMFHRRHGFLIFLQLILLALAVVTMVGSRCEQKECLQQHAFFYDSPSAADIETALTNLTRVLRRTVKKSILGAANETSLATEVAEKVLSLWQEKCEFERDLGLPRHSSEYHDTD